MSNGVAQTGNLAAILKRRESMFDPQAGWQIVEVWTGNKGACEGKQAQFVTAGYKTQLTHKGPSYELTAITPTTPAGVTETPIDHWELGAEYYQEDIRNSPGTLALAGNDPITLGQWIVEIEDVLKRPPGLQGSYANENKRKLYNLYVRGVTSYELKRSMLRRRRAIPTGYADQMTIPSVDYIFTTPGGPGAEPGLSLGLESARRYFRIHAGDKSSRGSERVGLCRVESRHVSTVRPGAMSLPPKLPEAGPFAALYGHINALQAEIEAVARAVAELQARQRNADDWQQRREFTQAAKKFRDGALKPKRN